MLPHSKPRKTDPEPATPPQRDPVPPQPEPKPVYPEPQPNDPDFPKPTM
jgi:hypothetical protein